MAVAAIGVGSASGAGATVDLYSSFPLQGASKAQTGAMVQGIKLALKQVNNKAGAVTINYTSLDDSTAAAGNWDATQTGANARKAAQDKKAVGYIGEFNSGASEVSMPILNTAGLSQVSPANTYLGLTKSGAGALPGEPQKYFPTGKRTYMRIVPIDTIQAHALLTLMKGDGCKAVALANDQDVYGSGLGKLIVMQSKAAGITIVDKGAKGAGVGIDPKAGDYSGVAAAFAAKKADCFVFAGVTANGAIQLYKDVAAKLPNAKLYGPDGNCESGFTNPKQNGIPAALDKKFQCTVATLNLKSYPGGQKFLKSYKGAYGNPNPDPYAIYGYVAAKLYIDTLKGLGAKATNKAAVLKALQATKNYDSLIGNITFDKDGDTTNTIYGVYKVDASGDPVFEKAIK